MTTREFLYGLPARVDPAAIAGLETLFHFDIDGPGGGQFTVRLGDGKVLVEDGLSGEPKCTVRASDENLVQLVTGQLNPMLAVLTGKVKISHQGEMMKYAKLFGLL